MPKAIVTGANGFIGRRLCKLLTSKNWQVTACGRSKQDGPWSDFIEWDISHDAPVHTSSRSCDTLFHLASKVHALTEIGEDLSEYTRINVQGTQRALEFAAKAGAKRFIYFSSVKAMGEGNADYDSQDSINESFACHPTGPYAASKLAAEKLVLAASKCTEGAVIRPCLVYGSNSKGNLTKMVEAIRKNRFPPIPEFGNRRSLVHVDDLCHLALACATVPKTLNEVFIAAEPHAYSTREMYELILKALQKSPKSFHIPRWTLSLLGRAGDIVGKARGRRFVFDSDALRKLSESAHYDGSKATRMLDFKYGNALPSSLIEILSSQ